jgi:hypothetical protein
MSEARSNRHRGKTTPTLAIPLRQRKEREALRKECRISSRRSGWSGVKHSVPRSSRADPKVREAPTSRKRRSDPGTHEVRVHAVHAWVAEVGRTHFASCPPSGRKARWWNQQGASQKEARSTV